LEKKAKKLNPNTVTIENGLYLEKFKRAKSLKTQLALEGKKVFGYIGGVAKWTGIDRAIKQYLKADLPNSAFLVVGGSKSPFFQELKERYQDNIFFVGQVSPDEVADYFKTLDVGLIPFERNDFTDNALPIKALEYALAGASVLSTPLAYLRRKGYPFVRFCEISEFAECMAAQPPAWHYDFTSCGWERRAGELLSFVKGSL
jgi:glycosyltransferase involved in cell wall biosynthesis